ncbi:LPP20 family lipoprotein [Marinomonas dokdonensis]|uniref:LPP20 family lipoprotein n=1 Tax=Marinomonas dokdonensis TaxID=328224 RepID=UPI0040557E5F
MTLLTRLSLITAATIVLYGCQTTTTDSSAQNCTSVAPCNGNTSTTYANTGTTSNNQVVTVAQSEPIIVTATGYAAMMTSKRYSKSQTRIMTLRSSTLDAYRNLSERVYGLKIDGSSSLSNMVLQHDELRTYVDAYLVGAKVVSQREHEDGTFETVVEMALQDNFRQCVSSPESLTSNPSCQVRSASQSVNIESPAKPATNFYTIE